MLTNDAGPVWRSRDGSLAALLVRLPAWYSEARCTDADADLFYLDRGQHPEPAKRVCRTCPVRRECLDEILRIERGLATSYRAGIWGGLTPNERERIDLLPAAA